MGAQVSGTVLTDSVADDSPLPKIGRPSSFHREYSDDWGPVVVDTEFPELPKETRRGR
jgi:hypothetical protein